MKKYTFLFSSDMPDYSDKYKFKIELHQSNRASINLNSTLHLTEYYDDKGYLHRYKVRDFL